MRQIRAYLLFTGWRYKLVMFLGAAWSSACRGDGSGAALRLFLPTGEGRDFIFSVIFPAQKDSAF